MMFRVGLLLTVLCVFLVCQQALSQSEPAMKIGVIDLEKLSNNYEKWQDYSDILIEFEERSREELSKKRDEIQKELTKKDERYRKLTPGSEEALELEEEIEMLNLTYKLEQKRTMSRIQAKAEELARELLSDIEKAVEEYGKANGFLVIFRKEYVAVQKLSWVELRGYASRKFILYADGGIDITDEIAKELNRRYAAEKKERGEK